MRSTWLGVSATVPSALVPQPVQRIRETRATPPPAIRSDTVAGPWNAGRLAFQDNRQAGPLRGDATGRELPPVRTSRVSKRPAAAIPPTGASRACTRSLGDGGSAAVTLPVTTAAASPEGAPASLQIVR
jgi:hypothetical protein